MDGGRRLLRPLTGLAHALSSLTATVLPLAFAAKAPIFAFGGASASATLPLQALRARRGLPSPLMVRLERLARHRFLGGLLVVTLFGGVGASAVVQGGAYADFVRTNGTIADQVAKLAGFSIKAITINGARELSESEILAIAGIGPRNSLAFLDVAEIRASLKAVPLVKDVSVSKLYPNRLLIDLEERQPFALWQKDGSVSLVAADGTVIDELHEARYETLPLVTGPGANEKIADYVALLEAAGDLRPRIRAGIFVAGRRWTLKTLNGVEIVLPERDPAQALSRLALLEHDSRILEKDILSLDLRLPGRVVARLSAEAGAAREEAMAKKGKAKGGSPT